MASKDLTTGKPSKVLWLFCLPLFGSIIFQQLYNLADSLVAGNFINEAALAAVGNGYEITLIFLAFAFGCNIGCSVVSSYLFGEKKYNDLKSTIYTTLITTTVLCVILMILGLLFAEPLLKLIKTPDEILSDSMLYLRIYIYGLAFVFIYNVSTGIFSALGDAKTPFIFLMASSLSNIGLDILFVKTFNMGISGVAWATFLCQGVSAVLSFIVVLIKIEHLPKEEGKVKIFSFPLLKRMAIIAIPSTLQQSFISVGNIFIQSVVNSFGTSVIAGYSAAIKLNNLMITSLTTVGNGISNYTAQNLGAKKLSRVKDGFKSGIIMGICLCIPFILLYQFVSEPLLKLFIKPEEASVAVEVGKMFFRIVSPFYIVVSAKLISDGVLRGSSNMTLFMVATFTDLILRVVLAFILSEPLGTNGIWLSWPIGWIVSTIMSLGFFVLAYKKLKKDKSYNS